MDMNSVHHCIHLTIRRYNNYTTTYYTLEQGGKKKSTKVVRENQKPREEIEKVKAKENYRVLVFEISRRLIILRGLDPVEGESILEKGKFDLDLEVDSLDVNILEEGTPDLEEDTLEEDNPGVDTLEEDILAEEDKPYDLVQEEGNLGEGTAEVATEAEDSVDLLVTLFGRQNLGSQAQNSKKQSLCASSLVVLVWKVSGVALEAGVDLGTEVEVEVEDVLEPGVDLDTEIEVEDVLEKQKVQASEDIKEH